MNIEKLNRTRIHLILFSPLFTMLMQKNRGGRNPFRATKLLGADCPVNHSLIHLAVVVILYCACEGSKQRFVPTGRGSRR